MKWPFFVSKLKLSQMHEMLSETQQWDASMFTYENGLLIAILYWLYSAVMMVVQLNSQLQKNLNRIGERLSWTNLEPKPMTSGDLNGSAWGKILKYLLIVSIGFVTVFLSWISVGLTVLSLMRRFWRSYGAPQSVKELRWKMRNLDMSFDAIVLESFKLDNRGCVTFQEYKEMIQRDLVSRGLLPASVIEPTWERVDDFE